MSDDGAATARYLGRAIGNDRFTLQSLLGEGGMASVYLAYDSVLDRRVAVKTLHSELGRAPSFRERFRREAQSVAKLTHTNIVSVFDSGEDTLDGAPVPYIVMEYVEGKPLREVLDEDVAQFGAMPADKALKITGDVLAALEASHELGLVHRDIKPGNVMVTKRGAVKVMDFGIARAMQSGVTSMTQTGMVVGTPQYLSPEQALGRGVDARADLYSVGIMLFELLTGRLPFTADTAVGIAYAHVQEEPVPPSRINRSVTPAMDALVAGTLRKNPDERFPTAEAMRIECERVRGSAAASGPAPPVVDNVVDNGPGQHGAGVGQAVFRPVGGTGTPPPPGAVPPPYQKQYAPGYAPSTPPPTGPMAAPPGGFNGPRPVPYGAPGAPAPPGTATPPGAYPAAPGPLGPPPKSGMSNGVIVVLVIAAVLTAVTLIAVIAASSSDTLADDPTPGYSRYEPEDTTRTVAVTDCTEARESYPDEDRLRMPPLRFNTLASVRKCIEQAGWTIGDITRKDENVWGDNMVVEQHPEPFSSFDPETDRIDLTVSTGMPAGSS